MSDFWQQLQTVIQRTIKPALPFRAVAQSESGGLVTIRRLDATADDLEQYARVAGFALSPGDEVVCLPMGGKPVVVGIIQRTTPTEYTFPVTIDVPGITVDGEPISAASAGRSFKAFYPTVGVNTFETVAITLNTPGGTQSTTDAVEGPWHGFTTGATSGNSAGIDSDDATWIDWDPTLLMHMGDCAGTTTRRIWCGLFSGTPSASDDPAVHGCGFRYSSGASDTNWRTWSNDGSGGGTINDSGVAFAATTPYKMELRCTSGQIEFFIDDDLVATHLTNLPGSGVALAMYFRITTLTNATRAMSIGKYELWHNP